jgi:transcriptional regulator NrdR family protein
VTCPTCDAPARVVACRQVDAAVYRRRLCTKAHRFVTIEQAHETKFPWLSKPKRKPLKKKKKPKQDDKWIERINAKLAEPS